MELSISDASATQIGDILEIEIRAFEFEDIYSFSLLGIENELVRDGILEFKGIENLNENLSGLNGSFDLEEQGAVIDVNWANVENENVTLSPGATLFTIEYEYVECLPGDAVISYESLEFQSIDGSGVISDVEAEGEIEVGCVSSTVDTNLDKNCPIPFFNDQLLFSDLIFQQEYDKVFVYDINGGMINRNLENSYLPTGIYVLKLIDKNGKVCLRKVFLTR
jgi:hypothetical protein